ncbi:MAG TPA: hypothetical protein PKG66_01785, partial [Methanothrix sp.]|nr:hypothetical protein [Methanothrix sp.]
IPNLKVGVFVTLRTPYVIRDDLKATKKNTEASLDEIKGLREDIQPGYAMNFRQIQADVRAIKDRLGMP